MALFSYARDDSIECILFEYDNGSIFSGEEMFQSRSNVENRCESIIHQRRVMKTIMEDGKQKWNVTSLG